MGWLNTILHRCSDAFYSNIALEIATRKRENIWERVGHRVFSMQPAEARGYVHARVTNLAHNEVSRLLLLNDKLHPKHHTRLIQLTIAEMVNFALADVRLHKAAPQWSQRAA